MTESRVILFHQEIGSNCLRISDTNTQFRSCIHQEASLILRPLSGVMSFHHLQHSKIPICSIYLCTSVYHRLSTLLIRLPNRKVLFDSFVKRKLRLPMFFLEIPYLFNK